MNSYDKLEIVKKSIIQSEYILIVTHDNPDGDAYGSALGLYNFLIYHFPDKEIDVFINSPENRGRFMFMPNYHKIIYESSDEFGEIFKKTYDVIFCLDLGKLNRIGNLSIVDLVVNNLDKTIYLDHHDTSEKIYCFYYLNHKTASSTSELIAGYFIPNVMKGYDFNKESAICFYAGIVSDTGKFSYNKTNKYTHITSSKLLEYGVSKSLINYYLYQKKSKADIDFKYYMLKNKIKMHRTLPIAFIFYDYATKIKYPPDRFSVKEVINEIYGLDGTLFVICLDELEDEEKVNISITTVTDFDVSIIAKMFNGGGHKSAAGGYFLGSIKDAYKNLMYVLKINNKSISESVRRFFSH